MGYMRHHAIVVTGSYDLWPERAYEKAEELLSQWRDSTHEPQPVLSQLSEECMNGRRSFCVFPDGSKEGWPTSEAGDEFRDRLIRWLEEQRYEDGSSPLAWVEVQYADDERETKVCRHSDALLATESEE